MNIQSFQVDLSDSQRVALSELRTGLNVLVDEQPALGALVHASLTRRIFGEAPAPLSYATTRPTHITLAGHAQQFASSATTSAALACSTARSDDLPLLREIYSLEATPSEQERLLTHADGSTCICGEVHGTPFNASPRAVATLDLREQTEAIKRLEQEQRELQADLSQWPEDDEARLAQWEIEDRQLVNSIRQAEQRSHWLAEEIRRVESRLAQLAAAPLEEFNPSHWLSEAFHVETDAEQRVREQQLATWQGMLAEARQRRHDVEQKLSQEEASTDHRTLLEAERTCLGALQQSDLPKKHHALPALCNFLSVQEQAAQREVLAAELASIARAEAALSEHCHWLGQRQRTLAGSHRAHDSLQRIANQQATAGHCRCEVREPARTARQTLQAESIEHHTARQAYVSERQALRDKLDSWQARRAALAGQRADWTHRATKTHLQSKLARCEQNLAHWQNKPVATQNATSREMPCQYLLRAAHWLAQLTGGFLVDFQSDAPNHETLVLDHHQQPHTWRSLSLSGRNMVRLSLSLAAVECWERFGLHLPLLLDNPFAHLKPSEEAYVAHVLQRFATPGRQVLLFIGGDTARQHFTSERGSIRHLTPRETSSGQSPRRPVHEAAPVETPRPTIRLAERESHEELSASSSNINAPSVAPNFRVYHQRHNPEVAGEEVRPVPPAPTAPQAAPASQAATKPVAPPASAKARLGAALRAAGIHRTGEFLEANPELLASKLATEGYTAAQLLQWQHRIALLHFVEELTDDDADVLSACDCLDLETLSEVDIDQLHEGILAFLRSEPGGPYRRLRTRYERSRLQGWRKTARRQRDRFRQTSYGRKWHAQRVAASQEGQKPAIFSTAQRGTFQSKPAHGSRETSPRKPQRTTTAAAPSAEQATEPRFYLNLADPVVEAPTIGPAMAERLKKIGIHTVADLLRTEAASIAARLKHRRTKLDDVQAWQTQSTLVCRVPQLRGHDAQILVAVKYTQPEQIASASPAQLYAAVKAFAKTKEGQRIIRNMTPPDLAEVTRWINWARDSRTLKAA